MRIHSPVPDGLVTVSSGMTLSGAVLPAAETLNVKSGGTIIDTTAIGPRSQPVTGPIINLYGVSERTVLGDGAQMHVYGAGQALDTVLSAGGDLENNGYASGTVVSGGYFDDVGRSDGTQVLSGGRMDAFNDSRDVTVSAGGLVDPVARIDACTVLSGGQMDVLIGGSTITDSVIEAGGLLAVLSGSATVATGTEIMSGARLVIAPGASLVGETIDSGANVLMATDVVLQTVNGPLLSAGNHLSGTVLSNGQYEIVYSGGVAIDTVFLAPAAGQYFQTEQSVNAGARAIGALIGAEGRQNVGGIAISSTVMSGGEQTVSGSGRVQNTVVQSGGVLSAQSGDVRGAIVFGGGLLVADSTAEATTLSGGLMTVSGVASGTLILSGGVQTLELGDAFGTVIGAGGIQEVGHRGHAMETFVQAGGVQEVVRGTALATGVGKGGVQLLHNGTGSAAVIHAGGQQVVDKFGTARDTIVESGGRLVDTLKSTIVSGTTVLLGGAFDFPSLAFASGATATVSTRDVLTVMDGGQTVSLQLQGDYTGAHFVVGSDGTGGSLVTLSAGVASGAGAGMVHDVRLEPLLLLHLG